MLQCLKSNVWIYKNYYLNSFQLPFAPSLLYIILIQNYCLNSFHSLTPLFYITIKTIVLTPFNSLSLLNS